jgi:8-oxo-dGTP pyrophosphatase MutT (NUDIX family)
MEHSDAFNQINFPGGSFQAVDQVVHLHVFTAGGKVILFNRSDGSIIGPVSGGVEFEESFVEACLRELEEETGIDVIEPDHIINADYTTLTITPNGRSIRITAFYAFLPEYFDVSAIRLNNELAGFKLCELDEAESIIAENGHPEALESFCMITMN